MSYEEFRKRIDTARQILVGAVPSPAGQIDQITYALMYKFMNDIDDQSAALGGKRVYFTGDYAKYNWHELMKPGLEAHEQLELYRQAIQGMSKNPGLPPLFREIYQNAFLPFNSPSVLRLFLDEINKFNHGDSDDIGDAYEYLLSITGAQGDVGQFRTPRHIIKFIVEAVNPTKDDSVLDPAVGTAGFLIAAYNHVKAQHDGRDNQGSTNDEKQLTSDELEKLHHNYRGFDIDPTMVRTASVNLYLHGFTSHHTIINHDSLSSEDYWKDKYDVILANPPFMTPKGGIQPHKKFSITANRAEVLFVDYIASHLKPNGRAGVIVPEGIIFQSGKAYKELRKNLVENYLYAVVSLPAGVFQPYSGVKTSILLMDRQIAKEQDDILFVKIENDGYTNGTQRRRDLLNDQLPQSLDFIKLYQLNIHQDNPHAYTIARKEILKNKDHSLSGDRYRISVSKDTEWPIVDLGDILKIERGASPRPIQEFLTDDESGRNWIMINDTKNVSKYIERTNKRVTQAGADKSRAVHPGDFILSNSMSFGRPYILKTSGYIHDGWLVLRASEQDKIDKDYLYYIIRSNNVQKQFNHSATGGVVKNLNSDLVKNTKIPLPPIDVQKEIVAELNGYQQIIDAAQTIVKNYRPAIKIRPEWPLKTIAQVVDMNPQKSEIKELDGATKVSFVPMAQLSETGSDFNEQEPRALKDVFKSYTYFKDGDVLLAKVTPCFENGKSGIAKNLTNGIGFGSSEFYVLRPKGELLPELIYYYISSDDFIKHGMRHMTGTGGLRRVTKDYVLNTSVPIPPTSVQHEIVNQLEDEREFIDANKKLIETYRQKIRSKLTEIWGE